jgi:hypothetical protein
VFFLAKDGTNRGGARVGAGRKPKPLKDKVLEGKASLPDAPALEGVNVPPPKEYMMRRQKDGRDTCAEEVYNTTWRWLADRGCDKYVNPQLVEQYAMSVSRWVQCEEAISEYGFLAKHPTTGAAIASPYVSMAQAFMKQTNQAWLQIFQIVKENAVADYGVTPQDDTMERLLRSRNL